MKKNLKRKLIENKFKKIRKKHDQSFIYNLLNNMIKVIENDINNLLNDNRFIFNAEDKSLLIDMAYTEYKNLKKYNIGYIKNEEDIRNIMIDSYKRFDFNLNNFLKYLNINITCSKGCSYCCHQNVHITFPSYSMLYKHIDQKTIKASNEFIKDHKEIGNPCIFLKDNICSVYSDRPFVCRSYFSVNPSSQCKEHYITQTGTLKNNMPAISFAFGQLIDSITDFTFETYGYQKIYDSIVSLVSQYNKEEQLQKWLNLS